MMNRVFCFALAVVRLLKRDFWFNLSFEKEIRKTNDLKVFLFGCLLRYYQLQLLNIQCICILQRNI